MERGINQHTQRCGNIVIYFMFKKGDRDDNPTSKALIFNETCNVVCKKTGIPYTINAASTPI